MKRARIFVDGELAGELEEIERGKQYRFTYHRGYRRRFGLPGDAHNAIELRL